MSSSQPSTKKTRSFRAKTLQPAGVKFIRGRETPDENARALWDSLNDFKNVLPTSLSMRSALQDSEGIPNNAFGDDSLLDQTTAAELIKLSEHVADSADVCNCESLNESSWRSQCHNKALSLLQEEGHGIIALLLEEIWQAVTLPQGLIISRTKPDYVIGYRFNGDSPLQSETIYANDHRQLNSFVNDARTVAFPLAVAESKSDLGALFEAENQCAENAIKMLYQLLQMNGSAAKLPVVCMALVGSFFTIHIGTTSLEAAFTVYRIHKMWSGDVSKFWPSLQFQIILWKLARWIRSIARNKILESLRSFIAAA